MNILNIKIDKINKKTAINKVNHFLNSAKQHKIFTPNPEMIVDAQKDTYFKKVLNEGDLNICDGFGLSLFGGIKRITGIDFMEDVCQIAQDRGVGIYLLGSGNNETIQKTAKNLQKQYPKLKITGFNTGGYYQLQAVDYRLRYKAEENTQIIEKINKSNATILFVAFGHNKQEKWIYENLDKIPNIKIAMGVGGAFDYISKNIKRAPQWMQKIGLEWLYRLIKQPKRFKRIFKAIIRFSFLIMKYKLFKIK